MEHVIGGGKVFPYWLVVTVPPDLDFRVRTWFRKKVEIQDVMLFFSQNYKHH